MAEPNWENRTLFHGDNLAFMRAMNSGSVDLIATDPPFKKDRDFHFTPDKLDKGAKFQDRWSWEKDVHQEWVDQLTDDYPQLIEAIECARYANSDGMGAFMCYMAVRILEMRRLLKPTGSIFLHCDPTASHYLKTILDAIFGKDNFQNEIVWCYKDVGGGVNTDYYKKKHDIIFWYSKDDKEKKTCELARGPLSETTADRFGSLFDKDGIITYRKLKDQRPKEFASRKAQGRVPDNLDEVFLSKTRGRLLEDYWDDIRPIRKRRSKDNPREPYRYPTQKPLALYGRLIKTASGADDIVLDPFAGCATTCVASENLKRQWVGIDIWEGSYQLVSDRLEEELGLFSDVHFTNELPRRTDNGEKATRYLRVKERGRKSKSRSIRRPELIKELVDKYGMVCQGCDRIFDDPRYFHLDHGKPRSDGGATVIDNMNLLCGPCNRTKSNVYTLTGLRRENAKNGWMAK